MLRVLRWGTLLLIPGWALPYAGDWRGVVFLINLVLACAVLMDACRARGREY